MNLGPVIEHLQDNGFGVIGKNLFREFMPHTIAEGILVTAMVPISKHPYAGSYRKGSFQVIVRSSDTDDESAFDRARNLANGISDVLTLNGKALGNMNFRFIRPREEPLVFPKSDSDQVEASVNFDFTYSI